VPELNAQTRYEVKYTDQALRISAGANCTSVAIDFDEPRVGADDIRKDLGFDRPCTSQGERIELADGVQGSLADSASVQPADCADQIRTSPLAAGSQPIRTGQVYCLNTSLDAARSQAITWKMVVLTVTAMAQDGTVTFQVTAWDIPV